MFQNIAFKTTVPTTFLNNYLILKRKNKPKGYLYSVEGIPFVNVVINYSDIVNLYEKETYFTLNIPHTINPNMPILTRLDNYTIICDPDIPNTIKQTNIFKAHIAYIHSQKPTLNPIDNKPTLSFGLFEGLHFPIISTININQFTQQKTHFTKVFYGLYGIIILVDFNDYPKFIKYAQQFYNSLKTDKTIPNDINKKDLINAK